MGDYMGKKVNGFLMIMLIVVLLGMGGLSIYYQRTFKNVNQDYKEISANYQTCQADLKQTSTTLQNTLSNLNSTESDIRKYDTLYEQKSKEVESQKDELATVKASLQKETLFKQQFQKQAEDLKKAVTVINDSLIVLQKDYKALQVEADCLWDTDDSEETEECN